MLAILCGSVVAAPPWKAPAILPSMRDVDGQLKRVNLRPDDAKEAQEIVASVKKSKLFNEAHTISIRKHKINENPDGSLQIEGTWERKSEGMQFYTPVESDRIKAWDIKRKKFDHAYQERVENWNHAQQDADEDGHHGHTDGHHEDLHHAPHGDDPARHRSVEVKQFDADREKDLRPIEEAARERRRQYSEVRIKLTCPTDLASKIDCPRFLKSAK